MLLKISARKSDLARLQAYMVGDALKEKNPGLQIEYRFKESLGDINLTDPLWKIPEKGVFTEDFYGELIRHETDMVVHSWKDLPTEKKNDTLIAATLPRADQRDLLLVKKCHFGLLRGSRSMKVFSSSPRREYNLTEFFKTHLPFNLEAVKFESVRGNIPTRIRKLLEAPEVDGLIVAKAALDRLLVAPQPEFEEVKILLKQYLSKLEWMTLPLSINPNAAAQGALAVEIASNRPDIEKLLKNIDHPETFHCAQKERDVLASFGGGCHQKIGIAVLNRSYGEISFLKGLTDGGKILNDKVLERPHPVSRVEPEKMWLQDNTSERSPLENFSLPKGTNAVFVARSEAWPTGFDFPHYVWTAGLKTWKNLAQKGIWVHGCSEGLGEQEDARLDVLVQAQTGSPTHWAKLSHTEGFNENSSMPLVATYKISNYETVVSVAGKDAFFWSSGSQFLAVSGQHPEILNKHHACGPGNTFKVIRQHLEEKNMFDPSRLQIFLDQEDWRQQCTK